MMSFTAQPLTRLTPEARVAERGRGWLLFLRALLRSLAVSAA
jgi:hypothetical protein